MKIKVIMLVGLVLFTFNILKAQNYIFFDDSPDPNFYDASWGFYNSPSYLDLINQNKFPVSGTFVYSGLNSLKLNWTSRNGGDWAIAVASIGWTPHDVTMVDSIIFMAYTENPISAGDLPSIFIEDVNNAKTPPVPLSDYNGDLPQGNWIKLSVPLDVFKSNPGSADLTQIKTIFFSQYNPDNINHVLYLDDIKMIASGTSDITPPAVPENVVAEGYDMHIDISWSPVSDSDLKNYYVYKRKNDILSLLATVPKNVNYYTDFLGAHGVSAEYKISAVDSNNNESELSTSVFATTYKMNDSELLTMVEKATFRYFWDYAHPVSGLIREGYLSHPENIATIGGTGFGLMAVLVGIERNFITREDGIARYLKVLNFLINRADRFHGVFPHWLDAETGKVIPFSTKDDGGDLVETAFLMQALLTARNYFDSNQADEIQIRNLITKLWEETEWDWYRRNPSGNYLYWHWSPNYNWDMNIKVVGWNEAMIVYLLAIASPTHPVPASLYKKGWAGNTNYTNGKTFYNIPLFVGPDYGGPLFFAHYSFLGFDPRNKKDDFANYFINNRNHTLINRAYCIDNPKGFEGYNDSTWGLSASFDPFGYLAHQPGDNDNGTISPTAAVSSIVYTPVESMAVLRNLYRTYGDKLWGIFGFKDAFNPTQNWFAENYLAIDEGPIINMIENYRSGLLWNNFMENQEVKKMLDSIGFVDDPTSVKELLVNNYRLELYNYPNPFNPSTTITYTIPTSETLHATSQQLVQLKVYDVLGREVKTLVNKEQPAGTYKVEFIANNLNSGIYFIRLNMANKIITKKTILLK